jgi:ABC-type nitrate/sulfonate/bicarbonate transport system substrate-binding protein
VLLLIVLAIALVWWGCSNNSKEKQAESPNQTKTAAPIRVGWQPPWANQGQLVAILKNTDLLSKEGVNAEFVPFTYGGPMTEAAIAKQIDVVFAGEQPVLTLLSKSSDWRVVARMVRYRSAIVVPVGSKLRSLSDLKGKTIATAFGSTTHRDLVRILTENGLLDDVKLVSLDQAEHAGVIGGGGDEKWGGNDGIATYDPTIAAAVAKGQARILYAWPSPGLIAIRKDIIEERREMVEAFLRAYVKSYAYYAANSAKANAWYSKESRLPLTDEQYAEITKFEPNLQAKSENDVDVSLSDSVLAEAKRNAEIALRLGILKSLPDIDNLSVRDLVKRK